MPLDWTPFVELVRRHRRFLIITHLRPDGDALGSELGLADTLQRLGKTVKVVIPSSLAPRYRFLDPDHSRIERFVPPAEHLRDVDVVIVVDTGTWNQLGDFGPFLRSLDVAKVVIDHHRTQDDLGALRLVDTSAEAAGRLVYEACVALGAGISPAAANAIFMALATDTGWFRHSSTTAETFALAETLVRAGAKPTELYDELFERTPLPRLKLVGRVLDRLQTTAAGRVAFAEVLLADYAATGSSPADTEDLINFVRGVDGVEVGLMFMEQPRGGVKVSFRSREGVDVSKLAEQFGGGGHRQAAGAILPGGIDEVRRRVLQAVTAALPPA